jgi:hypothetical protein
MKTPIFKNSRLKRGISPKIFLSELRPLSHNCTLSGQARISKFISKCLNNGLHLKFCMTTQMTMALQQS